MRKREHSTLVTHKTTQFTHSRADSAAQTVHTLTCRQLLGLGRERVEARQPSDADGKAAEVITAWAQEARRTANWFTPPRDRAAALKAGSLAGSVHTTEM